MAGLTLDMPENATIPKREADDFADYKDTKNSHERISVTPSRSEETPYKMQQEDLSTFLNQMKGLAEEDSNRLID